jgi:hypothetical protein
VTVPAARRVSVDAELGVGDIQALGEEEDGFDSDLRTEEDRGVGPVLRLDLEGGIGSIRVRAGL